MEIKEVSVGIIIREGRILACQRKRTTRYPLKWEFPGGKIEAGETPREALVRELHEELTIHAIPDGLFHTQEWTYGDRSYRVYYFLVREFSGAMQNITFEDTRWVTAEEMLEMDILAGNREAVEKLQRVQSGE